MLQPKMKVILKPKEPHILLKQVQRMGIEKILSIHGRSELYRKSVGDIMINERIVFMVKEKLS